MGKTKFITFNLAVTAAVCISLIWVNTYFRQRTQFFKGEAARAGGDYIAAIAAYEAAIHMYTPGSALVEKSAAKLWKLGETFERGGDSERALIAYRSLRSSFYAVRGLFSLPGAQWITRCDGRIASLTKGYSPERRQ